MTIRHFPIMAIPRLSRALLLLTLLQATLWAEPVALTEPIRAKIEQALKTRKADDRLRELTLVGPELTLAEIPAALAYGESLKELRDRVLFTQAVFKRWSALAPEEAFNHSARLPEGVIKRDALRTAAVRFAEKDPVAAAAAVLAMKAGASQIDITPVIAELWAKKDIQQALAWAERLPTPSLREPALHAIRFIWVHAEPVSAIPHVMALPADEIKNALLMNIAGAWAGTDPASAWKWVASLPADATRDLMFGNIVEAWGDIAPQLAAEFALKQPEERGRDRLVMLALGRWATQTPQAAAQWLFAQPVAQWQQPTALEIMKTWVAALPLEAGAWLEQLPEGRNREIAISGYTEAACEWSPAESTALAAQLKDFPERVRRVQQCLEKWTALQPEDAQRWIDQANFPDEIKTAWRQKNFSIELAPNAPGATSG